MIAATGFAGSANDRLDEILVYCNTIDELEKNFTNFAREGGCTATEIGLIRPYVEAYCTKKRALKAQHTTLSLIDFRDIIRNTVRQLIHNDISNVYSILNGSGISTDSPEQLYLYVERYYNNLYKQVADGCNMVSAINTNYKEFVSDIITNLADSAANFNTLARSSSFTSQDVENFYNELLKAVLDLEAYFQEEELSDTSMDNEKYNIANPVDNQNISVNDPVEEAL